MTTLFLSYARADDEPFVERLYRDLTARGFGVWWDRATMPNRALTFLHEIREAINARDRFVLVVGPKAVTSDYVRAEWLYALEIGKAINPVVRLGGYDLLPDELKLLDAPDCRDDAHYPARLETLVRQLSEAVAPMGKLIAVPSLPPHFLHRPERLRALKEAVLADLHRPVVITSTAARVGVHGMGGIGKSVLAALLGRDFEVRRSFPDGVVWVSVGQNPTPVALQRRLAQAMGDPGLFETEFEGKAVLGKILADKAVLLVLDDVWNSADAHPFDVLGPNCRAVITTRDAELITALGGTAHQVQLLTDPEALALLAQWAGRAEGTLPPAAHAVMAECGRLPLALAICGAMVHDGRSWEDLVSALRLADLEFLEHPHGNVLKSIKVSVDALSPDRAQRFAELAVFPPDETIPEAAVVTLWSHTGALADYRARGLLALLERRSLVVFEAESSRADDGPGSEAKRRISLHDLLRDYAARLAGELAAVHNQLLAAYQKRCPGGWPTGPDDGYFFLHLRYHLAEAGRGAELLDLLLGGRWLESKAEHGLVFDLPLDFDTARGIDGGHPARRLNLSLLEEALRRDIHFIARHPGALFQCIWNSGWWYDCPDAAAHYDPPPGGWPPEGPPWARPAPERLSTLLEHWPGARQQPASDRTWVQSLRPPVFPLVGTLRPVFVGHGERVTSVAFDTERHRIISGSWDETVRVWDVDSGRELACLRGHEHGVTSVAFDAASRRIASGSMDYTVRVWDADTSRELACLRGHAFSVASVAFDAVGRRIVSGSHDGTVRIWDAVSGRELACLRGHEQVVSGVAFDPAGRRIVSASWDKTVRVWDVDSGRELACLRGHRSFVASVAYDRDGRRIVSVAFDDPPRVCDADDGRVLALLSGHKDWVTGVAFDPAGRRIVTGSRDRTVRVWDAESGRELACLRGHEHEITSVAFDATGRRIVSGSDDKTVRVWDAVSLRELARLRGHESWITSVAFDPAGRRIATGSMDNTVRIWDAASGLQRACFLGHVNWVTSVAYDRAGLRIVSGSHENAARVWDAASGRALACLVGHEDWVTSVAFDRAGRRIVSGSEDRTVRVWDAASGRALLCLHGHEARVTSVAFDDDGGCLISGSDDRTVRVWDGESGAVLEVIPEAGDAREIAGGSVPHAWRAAARGPETVIERVSDGQAVAWFPAALKRIAAHPSGRLWAGAVGNHLYLIRLER